MRPKFLSTALENWLFENYPSMPNVLIAQELSQRIQEENQEQISKLRQVLPFLTNLSIRMATLRKINRLASFKEVTVDFVKKNAKRLNCPPKKRSYISQINREKSMQKAVNEWRNKSQIVPNPFSWFRTLQSNKTYIVRFTDQKNFASFKSSLNNFNRNEGPSRGVHLYPEYYAEDLLGKICVSNLR